MILGRVTFQIYICVCGMADFPAERPPDVPNDVLTTSLVLVF